MHSRTVLADESGETLVEILVTIVVIAVGLVAVVSAMGASIISSDAHRGQAVGEVIVRDFGEAIKDRASLNVDNSGTAANEHDECPVATASASGDFALTPTSFDLLPSGWNTPSITKVEYWIPSTFPNGTWTTSRATCQATFNAACAALEDIPACAAGHVRVSFRVTNTRTDYARSELTGRVLIRRGN